MIRRLRLLSEGISKGFLVSLSILMLVQCAPVQVDTPALPTSVVLPPLGKTFTGSIYIAEKRLPLPAGEFVLAGTRILPNHKGGYNVSAMLLDVNESKRLTSAVELFTNLRLRRADGSSGSNPGWVTHASCNRDDMHFLEVTKNERLGIQDCWWVNHWRMSRRGNLARAEHWVETRKYLSDNNLYAPIEMIGISYRLADADDFITLNVFKNPEEDGFPPSLDDNWAITTWSTSLWHPDVIKSDPRRKKYIEKQIDFGRGFHSRLVKAFR